jgi:hypothetical protein
VDSRVAAGLRHERQLHRSFGVVDGVVPLDVTLGLPRPKRRVAGWYSVGEL